MLYGLDCVAKGEILNYDYLLQAEAWTRYLTPAHGETEESMGAYVFPQVTLNSFLKVGTRFNYFTILSLKDIADKKVQNSEYSFVPTIIYESSEFSNFKVAYHYSVSTQQGKTDRVEQSIQFQTVFILGAHPAHDFED